MKLGSCGSELFMDGKIVSARLLKTCVGAFNYDFKDE